MGTFFLNIQVDGYDAVMKHLKGCLLAAAALGFSTAAYAKKVAPATFQLNHAQLAEVGKGEILTRIEDTSEPVKTVTSVGQVKRPARDVFLLMTDFRNYSRIYNTIEESKVGTIRGDVVVSEYLVKAPWPLDPRTVTTETFLEPERTAFSWRRLRGSLKTYEGELVAVPTNEQRCIVYYSAKVDPGYDWIPNWFVTWGQTYVLPSIIRAIRDTLGRRVGPYWEEGVARPRFSIEP